MNTYRLPYTIPNHLLNESVSLSDIRNIAYSAMNLAKRRYRDASKHVDIDLIRQEPIAISDVHAITKKLTQQVNRLTEISYDDIKKWSSKLWNTLTFGLGALSAGDYLLDSFMSWYDKVIQPMASAVVDRIIPDSPLAAAGLFIFLVIFAFSIVYYIGIREMKRLKRLGTLPSEYEHLV